MTVPANTAAQLIYPHSRRADFLWVWRFYDGSGATKTAKDLTGFQFFFKIFGPNQSAVWIDAEVGDGIVVDDNAVSITFNREEFDTTDKVLIAGCNYKMTFELVTPQGFRQPLADVKFSLTW